MMKVIRVNYNSVAAFLGVALVAVFCLLEMAAPRTVETDALPAEEQLLLPVAMYHHMLPQEDRWGDYVISPGQFEEDLQYIRQCGYTPISAAELLAYYEEGAPLPERPMMITFDDGNTSFYEYAYPLLQKYGMKAIVSVIGSQTERYSGGEPQNVAYGYMSWDMLREMQESGLVEVGNHTFDMHFDRRGKRYGIRIRFGESAEEYREALLGDVGRLSERMHQELGGWPEVFAYPFGALCAESRPLLTEMGFRIILTCEERVNALPLTPDAGLPGEEPIVLGRFNRAHKYSTYRYFQKLGIVN